MIHGHMWDELRVPVINKKLCFFNQEDMKNVIN